MLKANKGEWSELYTFFKLLSERHIAAADAQLNPIKEKSYQFVTLFRSDNGNGEYTYALNNDGEVLIHDANGVLLKTLDSQGLQVKTASLFERIKTAKESSFSIAGIEELMDDYGLTKIKAKSSEKTDLKGAILDGTTGQTEVLGFSIKSQIGNPSTLLNASSHTNFIFNVHGYHGAIDAINNIEGPSKIRDRINRLIEADASIEFERISSETFNSNLRLIDTAFGPILGAMLLDFFSGTGNKVPLLTEMIAQTNPYGLTQSEIAYKTKNFLRSTALGMVPGTPWSTYLHTYGGYIIVKEDGELVCYHLYNDDEFRDYLYENTKFDTPSSSRHDYGYLYTDGDQLKLNLNLQIRFMK